MNAVAHANRAMSVSVEIGCAELMHRVLRSKSTVLSFSVTVFPAFQ
jgi:hypothetical protein